MTLAIRLLIAADTMSTPTAFSASSGLAFAIPATSPAQSVTDRGLSPVASLMHNKKGRERGVIEQVRVIVRLPTAGDSRRARFYSSGVCGLLYNLSHQSFGDE